MAKAGRHTRITDDVLCRVWVMFELRRELIFQATGKRPSIREVARRFADGAGLNSVIGGDRAALAAAEKKGKRRSFSINEGNTKERPMQIFAIMRRKDVGSIRNLYIAANRKVRTERDLELVLRNRLQEQLGLPQVQRTAPRIGRSLTLF